jgi:hypothetical protein
MSLTSFVACEWAVVGMRMGGVPLAFARVGVLSVLASPVGWSFEQGMAFILYLLRAPPPLPLSPLSGVLVVTSCRAGGEHHQPALGHKHLLWRHRECVEFAGLSLPQTAIVLKSNQVWWGWGCILSRFCVPHPSACNDWHPTGVCVWGDCATQANALQVCAAGAALWFLSRVCPQTCPAQWDTLTPSAAGTTLTA